jgi:riboflavin kinase/FMN adenylyltransferase
MRVFTDLHQLPPFSDTVVTIGSFDGVHTGHRRILEQVQTLARSLGSESIVLTFEPHPRTVLHPDDPSFKLITLSAEKIKLLEQCGVDNVVLAPFTLEFARQSARSYVEDFLIRNFHPKYIVIGYDHRFGANREGNIDFLKKYEAEGAFSLLEIPAQEVDDIAVSSSKIRNAIDSADILHANRLLGYPFFFTGQVVEGNRIGRTIGFPTANIRIADRHKLIPPAGIYAARANLIHNSSSEEERALDAMLYIGHRPTIAGANEKTIEAHLLDFEGDLYGREIAVEVLDFIRSDKKLDGLEALRAQIEADKVEIEKRFVILSESEESEAEGLKNKIRSKPSASDSSLSLRMTPLEMGKKTELIGPAPKDKEQVRGGVAIVILNYNTRRHLQEYLPSVVAHSAGARIIVADNGSPDDSISFLREHYPDIEVLDLKQNYGFAQGYNEALRQVKSDIYVILNSDVEVTAGWMEPVLKAMRDNPAIAIAQPKIMAWSNKRRFEYAGAAGGWIDYLGYPFCRGRIFSHNEEDEGQYDTPQACFWAAGAAFFIRADLYHRFDGFDGDYFAHNEEIDLCWRLKRAGYQVWCIPQSVVYHLGGGTLEYESPRKVFLNFRNSLYTLLKNEPVAKLLWLLPARFLLDGVAGARFALKGQFRAIWSIVEAHFSFYKNFGDTLRKRRNIASIIEKERIGTDR